MSEFTLEIECPFCEFTQDVIACFDFNESYPDHCPSKTMKTVCEDCEKEFWYQANCHFDVELIDVFTKKPKVLK